MLAIILILLYSNKKYYGVKFKEIRGKGYSYLMKNNKSGGKTSGIRKTICAIAKHFGIHRISIDEDTALLEKKTNQL